MQNFYTAMPMRERKKFLTRVLLHCTADDSWEFLDFENHDNGWVRALPNSWIFANLAKKKNLASICLKSLRFAKNIFRQIGDLAPDTDFLNHRSVSIYGDLHFRSPNSISITEQLLKSENEIFQSNVHWVEKKIKNTYSSLIHINFTLSEIFHLFERIDSN